MKHIAGNSNRVTIREVARMAEVSIATVSNVINNRGKFSAATESKVRAAIQIANWNPNQTARDLARSTDERRR